MKKNSDIKMEVIDIDEFRIIHVYSDPPQLVSKITFNKSTISNKLIFSLMEISFGHGFACSAPKFGVPDQLSMTFLISTIIPTKRSFRKYLEKMCDCMDDIYEFAYYFSKQLDFSCIDISMFKDIDRKSVV